MTSSVQPSTPPLGATGVDETTPLFESTLLIEDQDNLLMSDLKNNQERALFETIDKDNIDSNFTIEANTSGGVDFDANIFNDEEFGNLASAFTTETKEEEQVAKSPILIEVPSNANFFNMKSSQEYTIEEDQPFLETFEMHQEKLEQEEKPSGVAPFTDASESSFMAGTSNLNDKMDMAPPTRLKFSVEGSYTSSSTTDPLTSFTAPSISIMEADDNPFSLTSPQDFSSNVSSNGSTSGFSNNHSARSSDNSPPSKSVKTENKSSASQRLERDDDLSGYTSDVSSEEGEQKLPGISKTPYFELRITLSQFNFFRVVRVPQLVNLNDLYIISMEALDWDDDKYREHPHYFRDEGGRIFASSIRTLSNIPPEEEDNVKDEKTYLLNQVLKHERSTLTLYYSSKKEWIVTIALQEIFDEKPPKDKYSQAVYCVSGRGGGISEVDSSKEGKFDKSSVNKRLQEIKPTE